MDAPDCQINNDHTKGEFGVGLALEVASELTLSCSKQPTVAQPQTVDETVQQLIHLFKL